MQLSLPLAAIATLLLAITAPSMTSHSIGFPPEVIENDDNGTCAASEEQRERLQDDIIALLQKSVLPKVRTTEEDFPCGGDEWTRVAFLNMSDPTHSCPETWQEYYNPIRTCGRTESLWRGCNSFLIDTNGVEYSKVCGRVLGYPNGSVDAFEYNTNNPNITLASLDGHYVDGISITYGYPPPRTHIWTFAAGRSGFGDNINDCPCQSADAIAKSPSFIGDNYFCESGSWTDPLWDGKGCEQSWCCSFNTPPWFSVKLDAPTREELEVRNCGSGPHRWEDTLIEVIELYIQ